MENTKMPITEVLKQMDHLSGTEFWYDWFCKDSSLANKGKHLLKKLKVISKSTKFDNDKCYVLFKNNFPCYGNLYDDFRICDIETNEVKFCVIPASGHKSNDSYGKAEVWADDAEGNWGCQCKGSWTDVKKWFLEK